MPANLMVIPETGFVEGADEEDTGEAEAGDEEGDVPWAGRT